MSRSFSILQSKSNRLFLRISPRLCLLRSTERNLLSRTPERYTRSMSASSLHKAVDDAMFSLSDYDVIGFDMDHTLCKYKIKAVSQLIYKNMCNFLSTEKKYPSDIFNSYEESANFYQRGLVIDMEKGNFLKLAEDLTILRATHGTRILTRKEIEETYGPSRTWEPTRNMLFELCERKTNHRPYRSLQDFFVIPAPYICAKIIDYLDETKSCGEYTFWFDVLQSISDMYRREYFKENKGEYFPALRENLPAYVEKCPSKTLDWLRMLKTQKKLFLLTGSHYDYATLILNYIIGENWREYFDICITYARKPRFFYENAESQPFLQLEDFVETSQISGGNLKENCVYSQGNWIELNQFFTRICQKKNVKALYFGDVIVDDVYGGSNFSCCDTVSILEEMSAEGVSGDEELHESVDELKSDTWGSFFVDEISGSPKLTFWCSAVMKYGRLAVPSLSAVSTLSLNQKVPSFTFMSSNNRNGFYPALPDAFNAKNMYSKI